MDRPTWKYGMWKFDLAAVSLFLLLVGAAIAGTWLAEIMHPR
jgi:hypothetical protein